MPDLKFITLEVLMIIVVPLLFLFLRGKWPLKTTIICLFVIPVIWYLTYSPIHELSHALGTYIAGGRVTEYKLIPSFWEGVFAVAWIKHTGLDLPWQNLVMSSAPYLVDLMSIIAGGFVLVHNKNKNALLIGSIFMLLNLRPTFDIICEAIGFYSGYKGDLYNIQLNVGNMVLSSFLIVALGLSFFLIYSILKRHTEFFEKPSVRN